MQMCCAEFVEKRRAALERYLNRTASHPNLRVDPDFRYISSSIVISYDMKLIYKETLLFCLLVLQLDCYTGKI